MTGHEQSQEQVQDYLIPVDQDLPEDDDEAYSSELESYATSLSSGVLEYNWEHGRRFHGYKEGSYKFPNDEREQDRLDIFHHVFNLALGGRLFLAPISEGPLRVLDIGTGTGIWAIEFADEFPSTELILGNDLSPIQPHWVPPNVVFEVDDAEAEWPDRKPFDFIHSRYMCGSIQDWPKLFEQAYKQTKPGGWVEFQDFHLTNYSEDGSLKEGNNVNRFYELLREACDRMNRPVTVGANLKEYAEEAGFQNVNQKVFQLPFGTWPKDQRMKEIGAFNKLQFLEGLEAFSAATFTNVLGWSIEEVHVFLALVRKDAKDRKSCRLWSEAWIGKMKINQDLLQARLPVSCHCFCLLLFYLFEVLRVSTQGIDTKPISPRLVAIKEGEEMAKEFVGVYFTTVKRG